MDPQSWAGGLEQREGEGQKGVEATQGNKEPEKKEKAKKEKLKVRKDGGKRRPKGKVAGGREEQPCPDSSSPALWGLIYSEPFVE